MMLGGAARAVLTIIPGIATGSGTSPSVSTNTVTATMTPPGAYTFLWDFVSGDQPESLATTMPLNGASQRWVSVNLQPGGDFSASWKCTAYLGGVPVAEDYISPFVQRF